MTDRAIIKSINGPVVTSSAAGFFVSETVRVGREGLLGEVIAVTESGHQRSSPDGGWTMAEAEGGISLPEGWQGRVSLPSGKYRMSLAADGKRLVLEHFNGTMVLLR